MTERTIPAAQARLHYAWIVTGIAFLTLLVAAGVRSAPAVLIVPLEEEFGWTRAQISFSIGIQFLIYGMVGPFSAALIERFGLRRILLVAIASAGLGFGVTVFIAQPWHLTLVWGLGVELGTGSAALVVGAIVANRWFFARRGIVLGVLTGSAAAGQLVFLPMLAGVVTHFGWRSAVLVTSAIALAILPLIFLLLRDRPADVGLRPYGMPDDRLVEPTPPRANPFGAAFAALGEGMRSRDFWILAATFFVCGASTFGLIGTHFIPACLDHGIPEEGAAELLAGMGVCNVIGTMTSGWLTDRFDSRHLLFWYYALRGVSLFFLPYAFDLPIWGLLIFGAFYGFDWITTVPPTVRLVTNVFGMQKTGMIYGWIMVVHQVGAAALAYASGVLRTKSGDYFTAYMISAVLCFIAALLVLRVGKAHGQAKRPVLAKAGA